MNLQLTCDGTPGINASFILQGQDAGNNPFPTQGAASIDDYASAFLVPLDGNAFQIVPKITLAAGAPTKTVNAVFNVHDSASGIALPTLTVSVDLVGPPPVVPPNQKATKVVVTAGPSAGTGSTASDPGSGSISFSLS